MTKRLFYYRCSRKPMKLKRVGIRLVNICVRAAVPTLSAFPQTLGRYSAASSLEQIARDGVSFSQLAVFAEPSGWSDIPDAALNRLAASTLPRETFSSKSYDDWNAIGEEESKSAKKDFEAKGQKLS